MDKFGTEQEEFWVGEFGNEYIVRNTGEEIIAANTALFSRVLANTIKINSVIELGANIGLNLLSIRNLLPNVELSAVEINKEAVKKLGEIKGMKAYNESMLDFKPDYERDLVLVKGVLIHINPDKLPQVYELIYNLAKRYICIAEYYNPSPVSLKYREHEGKLFKRDFAGEMLNRYNDLKLLDYGFAYHRDNNFPQDDINWFLLEKRK